MANLTPVRICLLLLFSQAIAQHSVKHVIVLMMENRSFDHLLGYLHLKNKDIDGLTGSESNPEDASDPKSPRVSVNPNGMDVGPDDPGHSLDDTTEQIFGYQKKNGQSGVPKMDGFVQNALRHNHTKYNVMSMFTNSSAPIINTLAEEFAIFDKWFASLPGPTDPNRAFAMSGTSNGVVTNFNHTMWSQQSYFDWLRQQGHTFAAYYQDDPWAVMYFEDMHHAVNQQHVHELDQFFTDVKNGKLADFTWLQPRMTSHKGMPTWQHPDASVREGERLIKEIYEALRASSFWEDSLFIITYDEHGGFYDHVTPPQEGVPNPDGGVSPEGFRFDRLGIRIPTVAISPWIPRGTVEHTPPGPTPTSQYDGTSSIATTNKILGLTGSLSKRQAWAGTFEHLLSLSAPRTDCPTKLPDLPAATAEDLEAQRARPLNDHMELQVEFYCKVNNREPDCGKHLKNQGEASWFIAGEVDHFFATLRAQEE